MATPCTLFTSCVDIFHPDELIRQVLRVETLPEGEILLEDIRGYDWHIETKYYTADIKLCSTKRRTIGSPEFADSMQAIVIYFDPGERNTFELAKAWLPYLAEIEPSIQILACRSCNKDHDVDRLAVQHWCIENDFELVELEPEEQDEDDDDDFAETTGIKRIVQALHAHTWSNLTMKDKPDIISPYMKKLMEEQSQDTKKSLSTDSESSPQNIPLEKSDKNPLQTDTSSLNTENCGKSINQENSCVQNNVNSNKSPEASSEGLGRKEQNDSNGHKAESSQQSQNDSKPKEELGLESLLPMDDMSLIQAICSEDDEGESFEQLFAKFRLMKEKAETLPPEQRKKYAEQVAVSFWKAMGGDEDEIDGLSDDSDR